MNKTLIASTSLCLILLGSASSFAATCSNTTIAANTPDVRFTDNGDGTVTDKLTHLTWMKCVIGMSGDDCKSGTELKFNWKSALQNQVLLNADGGFADHSDWRLPNRKELATLIDDQCISPSINEVVFPGQSYTPLWTSTPDPNDATTAWSIAFRYGDIKREKRTDQKLIRLVRDQH